MQVLIIGANGRTGRRAAKRLLATKHQPVAMIRNPSQRPFFDELGIPTVLGDLEYPIDHALKAYGGFQAVVFAAGSVRQHPDRQGTGRPVSDKSVYSLVGLLGDGGPRRNP